MRILADVRCLQDPCYASRGVGSHSASLLAAIRTESAGCAHIVGLIDPERPSLGSQHRSLCDSVQPVFMAEPSSTPVVFLSLSPMTQDTLPAARLLDQPHVLPAAVLYDFIPAEYPDRYLQDPASLYGYTAALKWLEAYQVFFPISRHVGNEAIRRLRIAPQHVVVTGVSLRPRFERLLSVDRSPSSRSAGDGNYVLFVGGADVRKNLDVVVEAFRRLCSMDRGTARLVIGGGYPKEWQNRLLAQCGTNLQSGVIQFLDHIDDEELARRYHGASVTVVASVAEGFSMPVIEAMACGSPVLVSDIPVHRELVTSPELRFDPRDAGQLAVKLGRALRGDHPAPTAHRDIARRFTSESVGSRFWRGLAQAFDAFTACRPRAQPPRRKRIAFVTPFPPDRSGVADYSASTVAVLGDVADVDVYTDQPAPASAAGVQAFYPISAAAWLRPDYDAVVAVIGNSHFHTKIIQLHRRFGGPCIVHDNRLAELTAATKGIDYLRDQARRFLGREISHDEVHGWLANPGRLPAPFYDDVLPTACPFIVHSRGIQATVRKLYGVEAEYLPFSIYREFPAGAREAEHRDAARSRLRIPADQTTVVSLGIVDRVKSPETCVEAIGILNRKGHNCHLHFVGEISAEMRSMLERIAARSGAAGKLHFMDHWLSEREYRDYLVAADVGIQLRTHFFGGLSGALLDCVAIGLPTVANEDLAVSVETPPYVCRVPDGPDAATVADAIALVLLQRPENEEISRQRLRFASEHSFENYVLRLLDILHIGLSRRLVG